MKNSQGKSSGSWRKQEKGKSHLSVLADTPCPQSQFKIGGYVRLSPTGEEREEGSLVSHPQRIKQFVELKNAQSVSGPWGEIIEWYVDKDLSGKDMNRPAFQRMLEDIKNGRISAVIVTELSRLNRKVRDFCEVWEFFKAHNVKFFSLKENFDTSTPMGELMLIQAMSFAQFERQTIVERIKRGAKARAERGLANGSVPLGFKLIPNKPNHREIVEHERAIVELIFRKFLELKKIEALVTYLNKEGTRTKEYETKNGKRSGGLRWTLSSVHYLLTNRAYIGEREINKKNRSLPQDTLPLDERYTVCEAQWKPLIPKPLFFDVQTLLEENRKKARKYVHQYRLTEFPFCEECGEFLVGKSGTGKNGQKYCYYAHKRKMLAQGDRHLKRCQVEAIPALELEEAVISRLSELSRDKKLVNTLIKESYSETSAQAEHEKSLLYSKEQERRKLLQKHENLLDSIGDTSERAVRNDLITRASQIKEQLVQVENQIATMKAESNNAEENIIDLSRAFELPRAPGARHFGT